MRAAGELGEIGLRDELTRLKMVAQQLERLLQRAGRAHATLAERAADTMARANRTDPAHGEGDARAVSAVAELEANDAQPFRLERRQRRGERGGRHEERARLDKCERRRHRSPAIGAMAALPLPYGTDDETSGEEQEQPARQLYPDEDPAYTAGEPVNEDGTNWPGGGGADGDDDDGDEANPETDAQFNEGGADGEEDEAYPDTDAQFGGASADDGGDEGEEEEAYPDTDAQFDAGAGGAHDEPRPAPAQPALAQQPAAAPPIPCGWAPPAWAQPSQLLVNAALEEWAGGALARVIPIAGRASLIVGRHGGMSDVVLADQSVSRAHAAFISSAEALFVQDLGSASGTFLDREGQSVAPVARLGARVPGTPLQLHEGDTVRMGDCTHAFRVTGVTTALPERFRAPVWASLPTSKVRLEVADSSKPLNPYLAHLGEGGAVGVEELPIHAKACWILGRSAQLADIVVRHESVSRQHCAIVHDEGATYVLDCGSASGTMVNNEDVGAEPRRVADGQMLSLGSAPVTYTFRIGGAGAAAAKRQRTSDLAA